MVDRRLVPASKTGGVVSWVDALMCRLLAKTVSPRRRFVNILSTNVHQKSDLFPASAGRVARRQDFSVVDPGWNVHVYRGPVIGRKRGRYAARSLGDREIDVVIHIKGDRLRLGVAAGVGTFIRVRRIYEGRSLPPRCGSNSGRGATEQGPHHRVKRGVRFLRRPPLTSSGPGRCAPRASGVGAGAPVSPRRTTGRAPQRMVVCSPEPRIAEHFVRPLQLLEPGEITRLLTIGMVELCLPPVGGADLTFTGVLCNTEHLIVCLV